MYKLVRTTSILAFLGFALLFIEGCSEDANSLDVDQKLTQAELKTILETDDVTGAVDTVLAELYSNAAAGKSTQKTNDCYAVEYSQSGFVATFNNCVLNGTENINGSLTVTYINEGETVAFTAAYSDFYVGSIKVNGTKTFTISSDAEQGTLSFTVTSEMTVVMEDESEITEVGTKTFGFSFGENLENFSFSISGNWTITADGHTYSIETTQDLESGLGCEYVTSGSMDVAKNGLKVNVDFGDGECDNIATLTYPDGTTEEIEL